MWLSKLCVYDESLFDMKMHRERACYHRGSLAVVIFPIDKSCTMHCSLCNFYSKRRQYELERTREY